MKILASSYLLPPPDERRSSKSSNHIIKAGKANQISVTKTSIIHKMVSHTLL